MTRSRASVAAGTVVLATVHAMAQVGAPVVGDYVVADRESGAIFSVDPGTGLIRNHVSGFDLRLPPEFERGEGPSLGSSFSLSLLPSSAGDILVRFAQGSSWGIAGVQADTGDRQILGDTGESQWESTGEIVLLPDGRTLVSTADDFSGGPEGDGRLIAYDLVTGESTLLSGAGVGDGPRLVLPRGLALLDDDTMLVAESMIVQSPTVGAGLFAVSLSTGDRVFVSRLTPFPFTRALIENGQEIGEVLLGDDEGGEGPVADVAIRSLAVLDDGLIYAGYAIRAFGGFDGGLLAIDPTSGDRSLAIGRALADDGTGSTIVEQLPSNQDDVFIDQPIGLTPIADGRLAFVCLFGPLSIFEFDPTTVELDVVSDLGAQLDPVWQNIGPAFHGLSVYVGAPCVADVNDDGEVDSRDVVTFLNLWAARDPRADIDGNGEVDTRDVTAFLNVWAAGC